MQTFILFYYPILSAFLLILAIMWKTSDFLNIVVKLATIALLILNIGISIKLLLPEIAAHFYNLDNQKFIAIANTIFLGIWAISWSKNGSWNVALKFLFWLFTISSLLVCVYTFPVVK